ncbi:hypothetical protein D4S03_11005 [bacterium]|nr:MAG: hypothetical protein D4S03_11005 [bacterium]
MKSIELAKEIAAAMSLRMPGTVGKIAHKMRYIEAKASKFTHGGVIRPIPPGQFERVKAIGISSVSNWLPAFGGVLYGVAALRQDVTVAGNQIVSTFQDSRVEVNDTNYLETKQRLAWREYILAYDLLSEIFSETELPDIIFVDMPLLVARGAQSGMLENEEIRQEWDELMQAMNHFWERNAARIFPANRKGPILVSVSTRYFGALLNAIKEKGANASSEKLEPEIVELIVQEWRKLQEVGILRVLRGLLRAGKRTGMYYYDALGEDVLRAEPKSVATYGLIGLHLQVGIKTPIWQLETLGNREGGQWTSENVDRMCSMIAYLTLYDNSKVTPLPLWYAQKLVRMPKVVLVNYYKETLRLLREQTVDAAWLEGTENLESDDTSQGEAL